MKYILILSLGFLSLLASSSGFISPSQLKNYLTDNKTVIIDVANYKIYKSAHIKGAINANITDFIKKDSLYSQLNTNTILQNEINSLGINSDSKVIIYAHNTKEGILNSSFLALVLIYAGFENVSILDGGYLSWVFENELLVSSLKEQSKEDGNFILNINKNLFLDAKELKINLHSSTVLDARPPELYYGISRSKKTKRVGHITYAKSSYYMHKFLTDTTLRKKEELNEIYINGYEIKKNKEIIVYGDDIFSASMEWFILYKEMGFKNTKIYYKSLKEWANDSALPMTRFKWE
ncbi:sulfurtransferase [Sulfurimonas sp.]|uniref:sulfurtransferase n=1 Tax=Sulfurimonas sp. TaxID=2022749 RepID=UPI002AB06C1B|nr:rhodanese-like domain-containing protein [Sulfurimonas sp.]